MVGTKCRLEEVLTEKQLHHVVKKYVGDRWELVGSDVRPACEGLSGFLGEHLKATLHVKSEGWTQTINLFIKRIPPGNKAKADFCSENNFYVREMLMFQLFEEMCSDEGTNPYCTKALLCNESLLVLPDLNVQGYSPRPHTETFDLAHVLAAARSLARLHAAFACYHTRRDQPARPYSVLADHAHILTEPNFYAGSLFLRAGAKLTANLLDTFTTKYTHQIPEFENKIATKFDEACETLREYEGTLNVLLHKDLWANNIMFRHEKGEPVNAILIDYQCVRYGPPGFDVMTLLYLTTSRSFREHHEAQVLDYYYRVFWDSIDDATKERMRGLGYDREELGRWCERGRMFGLCLAIGIFPFVLMEPVTAARTFDEPATFAALVELDRTAPVVAHARLSPAYRDRQVEAAEEFVERFVLNET